MQQLKKTEKYEEKLAKNIVQGKLPKTRLSKQIRSAFYELKVQVGNLGSLDSPLVSGIRPKQTHRI